jgi:hypothetical protein
LALVKALMVLFYSSASGRDQASAAATANAAAAVQDIFIIKPRRCRGKKSLDRFTLWSQIWKLKERKNWNGNLKVSLSPI